jgi:hypothetical protein
MKLPLNFNALSKFINSNKIVFLLGILILALLIGQYSGARGMVMDAMGSRQATPTTDLSGNGQPPLVSQHTKQDVYNNAQPQGIVQPANMLGDNSAFGTATDLTTTVSGIPSSCTREQITDPSSLLPKDQNSEWAQLNPTGQGNLNNAALLSAGHHIGIDTIGQSLRNANLQLRSEPANPQLNVGPWNNTTIEPETMRTPFEIGQGSV